MKILAFWAVLCAMMALTLAAALSESKDELGAVAEIQEHNHAIKRSPSCPSGWRRNNGQCFVYVPRAMTWAHAERNCQSMGANLASVHKAEEYHWIQRMITDQTHDYPNTWIGASDSEEEGVWFWSDGTPFNFAYWCKGEPNNKRHQHCLQINDGGNKCWDDMQCSKQLPSVCAKKI
ncbi:hypothetical protein Q5P01_002863 [Channa striata]|uniref:C-type lectin domain-containing protein n=1 Tax=Channa striata TaxID=64152 RepID=A0AA88TEC9_CHASR|nr:hypothetical protein Q5P01_002863 [Channa striata]